MLAVSRGVATSATPASPSGQVGSAALALAERQWSCLALKTLTSLNKEVRPFFLSENSILSFPSVSSLCDYSIWEVLKAIFCPAIIAFAAFQFIVPKYFIA